MNILLLNNHFDGAYGSLKVFIDEIESDVSFAHAVYRSNSAEESLRICEKRKIDFSLGIGKFDQFCCGAPIYEITNIPHYQWIIDNPLKMNIDFDSAYIRYLVIDQEFKLLLEACRNDPIVMPLGILSSDLVWAKKNMLCGQRREGIVFCGQIKDWQELRNAPFREDETERGFTDYLMEHLDDSFVRTFQKFYSSASWQEKKERFQTLNTRFRAYKRALVINRIESYPLILIGEVQDERIRNKRNVLHLGKMSYTAANQHIRQFCYSLNVSPNFGAAIHDRVFRSVLAGACPVTERSETVEQVFHNSLGYYTYQDPDQIEDYVYSQKGEKRRENIHFALEKMGGFTWSKLIQEIADDKRGDL